QPNKAVVGDNAFAHEAGIHQHGVLANRETYEIMTPETIGVPGNKLVLGKHSGRHALKNLLETNGVRPSEAELQRIFEEFKALCDKKKQVTTEEILALVEGELRTVPHTYALMSFHISTSSTLPPKASITLMRGRELVTQEATGDGPVDALYNAINRIVGLTPSLADYAIEAVTGGTDAVAEAGEQPQGPGVLRAGAIPLVAARQNYRVREHPAGRGRGGAGRQFADDPRGGHPRGGGVREIVGPPRARGAADVAG